MGGAAAAMAPATDDAELVRRFDLRALPPAFYEDPYPFFRALRRHAPIHRLPDGSWFLTRHADLFSIYRDTATFSSERIGNSNNNRKTYFLRNFLGLGQ